MNNAGNSKRTVTISLSSNDGAGIVMLASNSADTCFYVFDRSTGSFLYNHGDKFTAVHDTTNNTITITSTGSWLRGFTMGLYITSMTAS